MTAANILLGDGAMGTELARRDARWRGRPTLDAVREAPDLVRAIHRDHLAAGARCVTTNTFLAAHLASRGGEGGIAGRDAVAAMLAACGVARAALADHAAACGAAGGAAAGDDAAGDDAERAADVRVVGDVGPCDPAIAETEVVAATATLASALMQGGCDTLLFETHADGRALVTATASLGLMFGGPGALLGRLMGGSPTSGAPSPRLWLSVVPRGDGGDASRAEEVPLDGGFFASMAALGLLAHVEAVGCNCGPGLDAAAWIALADRLADLLEAHAPPHVALLVKPSRPLDDPAPDDGRDAACTSLDPLVAHLRAIAARRRVVLMGCCGLGPATIARWRALIDAPHASA